MNVIEVRNLKKSYRSIIAVDDISFSVKEGSIFGMLGPNGAGKSTTIECVIGLKNMDKGLVKVLNLDIPKDKEKLYNLIGVQLQETSYQDKIKVVELCELFMSMYDDPSDYIPLLKRFGLEEKLKSYISDLSGGQRQKMAIILALIPNPKIVFLDELTTGLDPKARREMWKCVNELREEGKTVFMTTHYMEEAEYLCDIICIIDEGKIIIIDDLKGVINKADIDTEITFDTDADIIELIKKNISGVNRVEYNKSKISVFSKKEDMLTDLVLFLRNENIKYRNIDIVRPKLEDAYLKLTGKEWKE